MMWHQEQRVTGIKPSKRAESKRQVLLKPEVHSHHQVEQSKVLPQGIADWVDGGIVVVATTCDMYVYYACGHSLE